MSAVIAFVVALVWFVVRRRADVPSSGAGRVRRQFRGRSGLHLLVWFVLCPVLFVALLALFFRPTVADAVLVALLLPVCAPWPLARFVAIPLGWPRATALLCSLADWTWGVDRSGGAALGAVLAARNGRAADVDVARARVERIDLLSGAGVVAAAFVADHDGDVDASERFLDAVDCFDPRVLPSVARRLARELRAQHLIARGAWADLAALPADGSRFVAFARRCGARLAGVGSVDERDDGALRRAWWLAPRRRRTQVLLELALAAPLVPSAASTPVESSPASPSSPPETDPAPTQPLPRALALHLATMSAQRTPTEAELGAIATAWDVALKAERGAWASRARSLGVVDVDVVARGVEETVVASLAAIVEQLDLSSSSLAAMPPLLAHAVERVRAERLDALEIATAALRHRLQQAGDDVGGDLAPVFELREWLALRALYASVARTGADGRALAWQACQWTLCDLGVRLWNVRGEHRLANAIHRWLRAESVVVSDDRARETHEFNVRCGP
jgi:hypothetical protein